MGKYEKCTLRAQETASSRATQSPSRDACQVIIYEVLGKVVPIVPVAAGQEELRVNKVVVLSAELEGVFSMRPGESVKNLVGILLFIAMVGAIVLTIDDDFVLFKQIKKEKIDEFRFSSININ